VVSETPNRASFVRRIAAHPGGRRRHLALAGAARDVERADEVDLRNGGVDQYVVSYHHGRQRVGLDSSTESSHHITLPFSSPLLHTCDPVLTSGRVKGGEAIT
jgi:hypothetical protein